MEKEEMEQELRDALHTRIQLLDHRASTDIAISILRSWEVGLWGHGGPGHKIIKRALKHLKRSRGKV